MSPSTIMPVVQPVEGEMHPASLAHLHQAISDARHATESFAERAEGDVRPVLEEFGKLHERHDRELVACMAGHGHHPDDEGGFTSLFHDGIARLKDVFGGVDTRYRAEGDRR